MRDFKILSFFFIVSILGCSNTSNILPGADINYLGKYHCWPYDVTVYSVDDFKIDSSFYNYPLKKHFWNNSKYDISTWEKYTELDTTQWMGMNVELEQCDDNLELYKGIINKDSIYYAGSFRYMKNSQGKEKRDYDKILFLDLKENKLHIFKNINKNY